MSEKKSNKLKTKNRNFPYVKLGFFGVRYYYLDNNTRIRYGYNVLAMKSSGIETLNYRMRTNLNRIINLTVSTTSAIFYSRCYNPFLK